MVGRVCLVGHETLQEKEADGNLTSASGSEDVRRCEMQVDTGLGGRWGPDRPRPMATRMCAETAVQNLQ